MTAQVSPTSLELVIFAMMALVFVATVVILWTVGVALLRDRSKAPSERQERNPQARSSDPDA